MVEPKKKRVLNSNHFKKKFVELARLKCITGLKNFWHYLVFNSFYKLL